MWELYDAVSIFRLVGLLRDNTLCQQESLKASAIPTVFNIPSRFCQADICTEVYKIFAISQFSVLNMFTPCAHCDTILVSSSTESLNFCAVSKNDIILR